MLVNTHKTIANNIYLSLDENKIYLNKNRFIWGNLKPDGASKYKFKRHYIRESLPMIIEKIEFLSSISEDDFGKIITKEKFSSEIGVVCHFLTDYFCLPHFERWEFKDSMKIHVTYEKDLNRLSKVYMPIRHKGICINEVKSFIMNLQRQYGKKKGYLRDLDYAYFVCYAIVNHIINSVKINTKVLIKNVV
ncbi:MAG: zinc dependent phospholipase C family protein [Clostridium sp.]